MLNIEQIAIIKGMLARGDKQHAIAAHFGVNGGRIADISTGKTGGGVPRAAAAQLPALDNGPRYIDPNAPLATQVAVLDQLRKNPPENSRRVTFTPALAEHVLLALNGGNRNPRPNSVRKYADDMASGRWRLTGDTVKFGASGRLLDGQHRLAACVRAGVAFDTFVLFGIDDAAFVAMDLNAIRKGNDTFQIASVPNASSAAAAVRWYKIFTSGDPKDRSKTFENRELLDTYRSLNMKQFDDAVSDAKAACRGQRAVHESALAALVFIYRNKHPKAVAAFLADLTAMKHGARRLVTHLDAIKKQALGRVHETQRNAMLVRTLNAYAAGKTVTKATVEWTTANDFPEVP